MLTLATHNICLQKLVDDEINWSRLTAKQRKRNDEQSLHQLYSLEARQDPALNVVPRKVFAEPFRYIVSQLLTPFRSKPFLSLRFPRQYIPERIFIWYCALLR
jgi:hypothetical protein